MRFQFVKEILFRLAVLSACVLAWGRFKRLLRASILILVPAFIGELSLDLWLTVKGVNVPKWKERASA